MDWLFTPIAPHALEQLEAWIGDTFFVLAFAFLAVELLVYALRRRFSGALAADVVTNYLTLGAFMVITYVALGGVYLTGFVALEPLGWLDIPVNAATVVICVVLADLAYYWEHRFAHRVGLAWATHSVHHSSPFFNISVAYRFGPLDGLLPFAFHAPLVLLGFDPVVVFFSEMFVQVVQTALHTELIRRLPAPIEAIFNTPSHHRVHHGSNRAYLDTNYGGIFIVWDRLFGTFAPEEEPVVYGLTKPLEAGNPVWAFLHGYVRLARRALAMPRLRDGVRALFSAPGWAPTPTQES